MNCIHKIKAIESTRKGVLETQKALECIRVKEHRKENNGGDEPIWSVIHIYVEMSQ
jgi:hypothetical protein